MKNILLLLALLSSLAVNAIGNIKGTVKDATTGDPLPFATIIIHADESKVAETTTDFDGKYTITNLEAGSYDITASYVGYISKVKQNVIVFDGKSTYEFIKLQPRLETLDCVEVTTYRTPLISKSSTRSGGTVTSEEISKMPGRDATSIAATVGGVYVEDGSYDMCIRGSRAEGTVIYIDGVKVRGSSSVPKSAIDKVNVITSGLPAKYENYSDGADEIINIPRRPRKRLKRKPAPTPKRQESLHKKLTAGELNDFSKWELWADIAQDKLKAFEDEWQIAPQQRYMVQVINTDNKPVVDCLVDLIDKKGQTIWKSRTDNTGKAELWGNLFAEELETENLELRVQANDENYFVAGLKAFEKGINKVVIPADCPSINEVDLAFVVDATGSMGDEINYLKAELKNIIKTAGHRHPDLYINLGSVFYRDEGDEYVTKKSPFSSNIDKTVNFIKNQYAGGGGDYPEAVDKALLTAVNELNWSNDARTRLLFIILDAPPHTNPEAIKNIHDAIEIASKKGIRIVPITASGINKSTEYLMRSMALATNGTYVFLTNHSGIGNPHIKPTTDKFQVELLNDLLLRLIYQYTYLPNCNDLTVENNLSIEKNILTEEIVDASLLQNHSKAEKKDTLETVFVEEHSSFDANKAIAGNERGSIKYYPNPANDFVNIETKTEIQEFYLTDISGKILEKIKVNKGIPTRIDIRAYSRGIYFFRYKTGNNWKSEKIMLTN